jgi:ABC-type transport system substrate-binding protein
MQARGDQVRVSSSPSLAYSSFAMKVSRPPFGDVRVRQAIDIGIDRQEFIDKMKFGDGDILGPINPHLGDGFWSLPESELREAYGMDLDREERLKEARDLLSAAGATDADFTISVPTLPASLDEAVLLESQLRRLGLRPRLEPSELLVWFIKARQGTFHSLLIPHLPYESTDIPMRYYYSRAASGPGAGFGQENPEVDALIVKSWGQFDREERRQTLLHAQRLILRDHGPMLNIYSGYGYGAAWSYVKNLYPDLPGSFQQYNYEIWLDL